MELAHTRGRKLRTVAPVLVEFLGGSPRRLRPGAQYVSSLLEIGAADETLARRAAALRQRALDLAPETDPSAIDALVATEAELADATLVIDGDRAGFDALAQASGTLEVRDLSAL